MREWSVGDLVDVRLPHPHLGQIWQPARIVATDGSVVGVDLNHDYRVVDKHDLRPHRGSTPPWMIQPKKI